MLKRSNVAKSFDTLAISLSVLHNYCDGPTIIFKSVSIIAQFLDSTKLFFMKKMKSEENVRYAQVYSTNIPPIATIKN